MFADAVFEGGGVKGIGLVGGICYLEEIGYKWKRVAGTSAGAIVAGLIAAGYKGYQLKKILLELNYEEFIDKGEFQSIPVIGSLLGVFLEKGIYSGDYLENWIDKLLKQKGKSTFKDVYVKGESRLKIIASDITQRKLLILPDDLEQYNINPLEFSIAKAVRMSAAIPLYYEPVIIKNGNERSYIVDGGLMSNFPVWIFDVNGKPRWPTFGFKLVEPYARENGIRGAGMVSYLLDIVDTMLEGNEERYIKNKEFVRTIPIPTMGVKTTEFKINRERSIMLYNSGYNSAKKFIKDWNFDKYVQKFRLQEPLSRKEIINRYLD